MSEMPPPLSHRSGIEEFVKHVIPSSVTTVVTEVIEYAAIAGPVLTVNTLGTPALSDLRITRRGYVNVEDRKILPAEVSISQ